VLSQVLLVRGWSAKAGWGFPKGKINKDEDDETCAVREVYEETGFDITALIDPAQFLEATIKEQRVKLFIVGGVPEDYEFEAQTRQEIGVGLWLGLRLL
jgi:8-oxo-dGTP pyrophosphatase MutT (NUDIX family)